MQSEYDKNISAFLRYYVLNESENISEAERP